MGGETVFDSAPHGISLATLTGKCSTFTVQQNAHGASRFAYEPDTFVFMAVSKDLVDILCCPLTKVPVRLMTEDELKKLNEAVGAGRLKQADGATVTETMEEALITEDGVRIYKVKESIPIMLKDQAIDASQLA